MDTLQKNNLTMAISGHLSKLNFQDSFISQKNYVPSLNSKMETDGSMLKRLKNN